MRSFTFTQLFSLSFIVFAGILAASALSAWTGPTATAPSGNVAAPINVGTTDQVKNAGLSVNAIAVFGSGYVQNKFGIGQASPVTALDVGGTLRLGNGGEVCQAVTAGALRYNAGAIQYCNGSAWTALASGNSSQWTTNGSAIYYSGGYVGIGTQSPTSLLTVTSNPALPAPPPDPQSPTAKPLLHVGQADGVGTRVVLDSFGATNNLTFRMSRGTAAAPQALQAGDLMANITFFGYASNGYTSTSRGGIQINATANWTSTSQPLDIRFLTTAINSQSPAERLRITSEGRVGIGNASPAYTMDVAGSINSTSGYYAGGVAGVSGSPDHCWTYDYTFTSGLVTRLNQTSYLCGADVAEPYPTDGSIPVERGYIVAPSSATASYELTVTNPAKGESTTTPYTMTVAKMHVALPGERESIYGAVPTRAFDISGGVKAGEQLVSLAGHVPVHVTLEHGAIAIGDPITLSDTKAGYGTKATTPGRILGYALAPYAGEGSDMIEVSMKVQEWQPAGEICAYDSSGSTCITKAQLDTLLR